MLLKYINKYLGPKEKSSPLCHNIWMEIYRSILRKRCPFSPIFFYGYVLLVTKTKKKHFNT